MYVSNQEKYKGYFYQKMPSKNTPLFFQNIFQCVYPDTANLQLSFISIQNKSLKQTKKENELAHATEGMGQY